MIEIGLPGGGGWAKSSRSSIRATVVEAVRRRIASMPIGSSHSALYRTSGGSGSRVLQERSSSRSAQPPPSSSDRRGRVSVFPEGSPTCAVKSPTIRTAVCPASWNCRSLWSTTAHPSVTTGAVGSSPSFTRSGRPRLSLRSSSLAGTTSAEPASRFGRSSGPMARRLAVGRFHPWQDGGAMAPCSRTLLVGVFVFALAASACDLPSLHEARENADALPETSFIYSAAGALITSLHAGENRVVVRSGKVPDVVRDAVIAIEDQRFYDHSGLDVRALLRAAYRDATTGEVVEGGSTITQQLVKKLYVGDELTVGRKIREAYLAWQLEQRLSKDRILTRYLNTVYFGNGAYGILAASETYFGIEPLELTLSQAATLAGLIAAPVDYDPVRHPGRSERRRNHVLTLMLGLDMIDEAEFEKASGSPIAL